MAERHCENCAYEALPPQEEPCDSCEEQCNWKHKDG